MEDEILKEFLAESWENLARLDNEIVELESKPGDKNLLASIFRTIHTIKGTCGFIGLEGLGSVAHAGENVLGQMRDGKLSVTPDAISLVLQAIDAIKELLSGIEETGKEPQKDNSRLIARLNEFAEGKAPTPAAVPVVATPAASTSPRPVAEAPPAPATHAPAPIAPLAPTAPFAAASAAAAPAPVKPPEAVLAPAVVADSAPAAAAPVDPPFEAEAPKAVDGEKKSTADLSIRINVDVVDRLMNLVGELVLTRNQLLQLVRSEEESKYGGPITQLNRVTTDLQEGVMKTRMQPIGNAWSKLPRLVRDLTQTTGKQIHLHMSGEETELDRTVLDAIKDPLTHMIRNSADHGLELPAARRAAGKSEAGNIRLTAFHEGGHVIICIEDDGAGIPVDKVRQKAIKNGLVSEHDAARLSEKEIVNFVFLPGLSTAEKVTSVSGRGVGMDVVRTQIERIGGTVDLSSRTGFGTTVRIKIPLTLAIINALVVGSGGLSFAIPQLSVVELVRLAAEDRRRIERIHKHEVFRLRHRLLPLVHLDSVLRLTPEDRSEVGGETAVAESDRDVNIVVVQVGEDQFGLIVDEVFDTEEIVVKPVGSMLKTVPSYQGTTILGDGRVIMILDVNGIAASFGGFASAAADRENQKQDDADLADNVTGILLFDAGGARMAVPLSLVARLEEVPRDRVERSGDRVLVQYRGSLLPLLPVSGCRIDESVDPMPVIVFTEGTLSMGLMVQKIEDIIHEPLLIRIKSSRPGTLGTAVVNGTATDVIDTHHYVTQAFPDWFGDKPQVKKDCRVLVVDDSLFFRHLVQTTLESEGYRVVSCDQGEAALRQLQTDNRFDLVVSDIEMPVMDGITLAKRIREAGHAMPLLAMTSLSGGNHESQAKAAGFDRFLVKYNARQFLTTVLEIIHRPEVLTGVSA
jgi:two-component system chemotaxis sensor kinase CheA